TQVARRQLVAESSLGPADHIVGERRAGEVRGVAPELVQPRLVVEDVLHGLPRHFCITAGALVRFSSAAIASTHPQKRLPCFFSANTVFSPYGSEPRSYSSSPTPGCK